MERNESWRRVNSSSSSSGISQATCSLADRQLGLAATGDLAEVDHIDGSNLEET